MRTYIVTRHGSNAATARYTCPDRTNERKWYTLVQVTSAVTPEDHDSETVIDWVRARCAVEAEGKAREGFHPVATFQGRRKGF